MPQKNSPTIRDVATLAGVSIGTVSNFLNGIRKVSDERSNRISKAIQQLDFKPNQMARNLSRRKSSLIGLCVPQSNTPYYATLVEELERVVSSKEYELLHVLSHEDPDLEYARVSDLLSHGISGMLLVPTHSPNRSLDLLSTESIPTVIINRFVDRNDFDQVTSDVYSTAFESTTALINAECSKIIFVTQYLELATTADRIKAIRSAVTSADKAIDVEIVEFRNDINTLNHLLNGKLNTGTGVIVSNGVAAAHLIRLFKEWGIKVPQDVSMICLDSPSWADLVSPALSVANQPIGIMAKRAWELLENRFADNTLKTSREIYKADLKLTESVKRL